MGAGHGGCREPHRTSNAPRACQGMHGCSRGLPLLTLCVTQTSALREIVETWEESSGGFLPTPERRRGPKGDPGERGPPGKEVCAGYSSGEGLFCGGCG